MRGSTPPASRVLRSSRVLVPLPPYRTKIKDKGIIYEVKRPTEESVFESQSPVSITGVTPLTSYNWIKAPVPTIAVPGSPPLWNPPDAAEIRVKRDVGRYFIAHNTAHYRKLPLEPLFRALYLEHPTFDINSIDIVADRGTLRRLLSFVSPGYRARKESYIIKVEVRNNTALFQFVDWRIIQNIRPHDLTQGFGHEFERTFTTDLVQKSKGHQRILAYRLGGLGFLVRHELDGYTSSSQDPTHLFPVKIPNKNKVEDKSALVVVKAGHTVPTQSTLELKTSRYKPTGLLSSSLVMPQLWLSQTPNLVRARYTAEGVFTPPEVEDMTDRMKAWEERHNTDLRHFVTMLKNIISAVKKEDTKKAIIKYSAKYKKLHVKKPCRGFRLLPRDLYDRFDQSYNEKPVGEIERATGEAKGESEERVSKCEEGEKAV
ncbi:hypothetical protein BDW74DRAFT_75550 [Aspergillus multicolor]|uniref:uncharacterized protein n=1 Tax=Aspergillus multicolor TaxID=41759 RepID=UPI003CCC9FC9